MRQRLLVLHHQEIGDRQAYLAPRGDEALLRVQDVCLGAQDVEPGHDPGAVPLVGVVQTIQRIISFYPPHQHEEVRMSVASNLQAVITQRLIPRADGHGRVPLFLHLRELRHASQAEGGRLLRVLFLR